MTKSVTEEQQRSRRKDGLPRRGWPILAWLVAYPRLRTIQVRRTAVRLEPSQNRLSQIAQVISCQPLKLHSIKYNPKIRLSRDLPDIINLIRINEVNIKDRKFKELCVKYGTEEIYRKILEHLQ